MFHVPDVEERGRLSIPLVGSALGVFVVLVFQVSTGLKTVNESIEAIQMIEESYSMPDFSTSWVDTHGVSHTVNTFCKRGQSTEDCAAEHAAKVAALQELFPPA